MNSSCAGKRPAASHASTCGLISLAMNFCKLRRGSSCSAVNSIDRPPLDGNVHARLGAGVSRSGRGGRSSLRAEGEAIQESRQNPGSLRLRLAMPAAEAGSRSGELSAERTSINEFGAEAERRPQIRHGFAPAGRFEKETLLLKAEFRSYCVRWSGRRPGPGSSGPIGPQKFGKPPIMRKKFFLPRNPLKVPKPPKKCLQKFGENKHLFGKTCQKSLAGGRRSERVILEHPDLGQRLAA